MNPTLVYLSRQLLVPQISMVSSTVNLLKGAIFTQIYCLRIHLKIFNHAPSQTPSTNLKYMKLSYALLIFYSKNSKMFFSEHCIMSCNCSTGIFHDTLTHILYTRKHLPQFYFLPVWIRCQRANLRLNEIKTIFKLLCLVRKYFTHNCVRLNSRYDETLQV